MTEQLSNQDQIIDIVVFVLCALILGTIGVISYTRPDVVDRPMDGWWGRFTNNPPEQKENRFRVYRKAARRTLFVAAVFVLVILFRVYTLLVSP